MKSMTSTSRSTADRYI